MKGVTLINMSIVVIGNVNDISETFAIGKHLEVCTSRFRFRFCANLNKQRLICKQTGLFIKFKTGLNTTY